VVRVMGKDTAISWATATWNPWIGCHPVSAACNNCYAEAWARRCGRDFSKVTRASNATFYAPSKWKDPRRIFVCSLSDFFHPNADEWRPDAWGVIHEASWHTYLILTKRPEFMAIDTLGWSQPSYVWLGVTAENQEQAEKRMPALVQIPAALHFVSIEPVLGPINLGTSLRRFRPDGNGGVIEYRSLDWVIVGCESGPNRRECKVEWIEDIVDQCRAAKVPVFVKQGSHRFPGRQRDIPDHLWKIKEIPT